MSKLLVSLPVAVALTTAACGGASTSATQNTPSPTSAPSGAAAAPTPSPTFPSGTMLIQTDHGAVLFKVLVASTPAEQQYGLMNRTSMPQDAGMVFVFFQPTTVSF